VERDNYRKQAARNPFVFGKKLEYRINGWIDVVGWVSGYRKQQIALAKEEITTIAKGATSQ
jgi:hypothetical protein